MNELRRSLTAELSLLAVAALWGGSFVLVHDALAQISPLEFLAIRFTLATLVVGFVFRRQLLRFSWAGWKAGLAMGAALTAGFLLQTEGLRVTTASNAGFITGLFVVITPLLGALLLRSPVSWEAWVGAALAALGLYLLSGASGDWNRGDLLELGCALAFACHILLTDRMVRRHPPGGLLVVQLGTLALVAVAGSLASGGLALP
nr:DMT family transporter [Thermoanaerobaculia bacterium]